MRRRWVWGCFLFLFGMGTAGAADLELFKGERFQGGPWRIRAEKITYDAPHHTYLAQGRVEIRQGPRRITADQIEVNEVTRIAWAKGNVVLVVDEDIFAGQEGVFNLATRCGEMYGARLFLRKNHFHVDSPLIRKTGDNTYYAEKAVVSTCDADRPVWSFAARSLNVVLEGYATARETSLRLAGVPVLYLPFAVLPVKTTRETGFLLPAYGQHKAGGTVVELPFYWAIDNFSDATLYQTYLSNRGYLQGAEFRRYGHQDAAIDLRGFYLSDHIGREAITPHRYWVAGMVNQPLGNDWDLRLTVDRVSDTNYLKDFNFGYMGLNRYSRDLLAEFGRDLEQEEVNVRTSSFLLSRNFSWANLTAYSRYYERLNLDNPRLFQRLPGVTFQTAPLPLGNLPLYFGVDSSYTYFTQDHGMNGDRLDLHPQMWLQGQWLPGVSFSSRLGLRETLFRVDHTMPQGPTEGYLGRQLYDSKVSLAGAWARDYGRDADSTQFYRHILRPEITYWNLPRYAASRYPNFDPLDLGWVAQTNRNLPVRDGDDPLGGVNAVTYGISNNVLRRGRTEQGQTVVKDLFWFRLSQSTFFNKTSMGLDGLDQPHNRFSDILGEMEYYPFRQVILGTNLGVSPYKEAFNRADIKVTFLDYKSQNYLNVNYLFIKDFAKQINVMTYLNLMNSLKTWLTYSHTFLTDNKLENRYGIVFQRQCWGVVLSYTERPDDKRFGFTIFIPGLGEKLKRSPVRFPEEGKGGKEGFDVF